MLSRVGVAANSTALANHRFAKYDLATREPQLLFSLDELTRDYPGSPAPLTEDQVTNLQPFVTAYGMSQAREGISDLGTLIGVRKRVTFNVTPGISSASVAGNYRLRASMDGRSWQRSRNLERPRQLDEYLSRLILG